MTGIQNIYLAGKIAPERGNWREGIISSLYSMMPNDSFFNEICGNGWPIVEGAIFERFNYTGPHFVRGHGVHGDDSHGLGCHSRFLGDRRREWTVENCKKAIEHSDVVFAWINSIDCYGTIAEIGYAKAIKKLVWIAGPKFFRDLWFIYEMADRTLMKYWTPRSALQTFIADWEQDNLRFDSPIEQSFWNTWRRIVNHTDAYQLSPQHAIGRYRVDFAHVPTMTAIELDGFATHSSTEDIANDRKRQREIEAMGWHVIRFGGKEVHHDVNGCVEEVVKILLSRIEKHK